MEERFPPPRPAPTGYGNEEEYPSHLMRTSTTTNALEPPDLGVKTQNDGNSKGHEQHFSEHEQFHGHEDEGEIPSKMTSPPPFCLSKGKPETYVVQIPRDQVYRVPPPENAEVFEKMRLTNAQNSKNGGKGCLWICIVIALVGIIIGITTGVVHIMYNPQLPEFSVSGFAIKNSQPNSPNANPNYLVTLIASNKNSRFDVIYNDGGKTSLQSGQNVIAEGGYPTSIQQADQSNEIQVTLDGSRKPLPSQINKGMHDPEFAANVPLRLNLELPIETNSWIRKFKSHVVVNCNFTVSSLAKDPKVLDQSCQVGGNNADSSS